MKNLATVQDVIDFLQKFDRNMKIAVRVPFGGITTDDSIRVLIDGWDTSGVIQGTTVGSPEPALVTGGTIEQHLRDNLRIGVRVVGPQHTADKLEVPVEDVLTVLRKMVEAGVMRERHTLNCPEGHSVFAGTPESMGEAIRECLYCMEDPDPDDFFTDITFYWNF